MAEPARTMVIEAERLFDGERFHRDVAVVLEGDRIADVLVGNDVRRASTVVRLPPGTLLAPGFIDVQVNGGGGVLLNDDPSPDGIAQIARAHRRFGTTGLLPTLISESRDAVRRAVGAVAAAIATGVPGILGIHLEGPFLNVARKGVHPASHIGTIEPADVALLASLGDRGVTVVTLAPECVPEGVIADLARRGVKICAGHTDATAARIGRAADEGLSGVTHLYNAMSQLGSREPGVVGAALADARLFAGIIADGHHVADLSLKVALLAKTPARLMLVTDAMPPVGTAITSFRLFGSEILVQGNRCTTRDGTLAGAALDMAEAVRHLVRRLGVEVGAALAMASRTPAAFLGLEDRLGRIAPGFRADLVALDSDLQVLDTWIGGSALP